MFRFSKVKRVKTDTKYIITESHSADQLLTIIHSNLSFVKVSNISNHFEYVKLYVKLIDSLNRYSTTVDKIERMLVYSNSVESLKFNYVNMVNNIEGINIELLNTNFNITGNICPMCNSVLPSGHFTCECGCIAPNLKVGEYYGEYAMISKVKEDKKMYKFLRNLSCSFRPSKYDDDYEQKLDEYFLSNNMMIGSRVSTLFSNNMSKIDAGYTIIVMYDALLSLRFDKPAESVYFYMNLYWNWDNISIDSEIIATCSSLYNSLLSYMITNDINRKVTISTCAWWFLNHCGVATNLNHDYKRNKSSSDVVVDSYEIETLTRFSNEYGVKIPKL